MARLIFSPSIKTFCVGAVMLLVSGCQTAPKQEPKPPPLDINIPHIPDSVSPAEPTAAEPKPVDTRPVRHRAVVVEIKFRSKGKKKPKPYTGRYEVVDQNNKSVSDGPAPRDGSAVTLILSPANYEIRIPKTKVRQPLPLYYDVGDRVSVEVLIDKK